MPNREQIVREYKTLQDRLINESFELAAASQHLEGEMSTEVEKRLDPRDSERVRFAEGEAWAAGQRERLKTRHEELDVELRAALQVRMEEVEETLTPQSVSFQDRLAAASATPEALNATMDLSLSSGDEDAALLAFQAGRQRDLEEVTSHAITIREDWAEFYSELIEIEKDQGLELDPGDRFEMLASPAPTKEDLRILGAPQSDINIYGRMR